MHEDMCTHTTIMVHLKGISEANNVTSAFLVGTISLADVEADTIEWML
jgi:hypothetical protein